MFSLVILSSIHCIVVCLYSSSLLFFLPLCVSMCSLSYCCVCVPFCLASHVHVSVWSQYSVLWFPGLSSQVPDLSNVLQVPTWFLFYFDSPSSSVHDVRFIFPCLVSQILFSCVPQVSPLSPNPLLVNTVCLCLVLLHDV